MSNGNYSPGGSTAVLEGIVIAPGDSKYEEISQRLALGYLPDDQLQRTIRELLLGGLGPIKDLSLIAEQNHESPRKRIGRYAGAAVMLGLGADFGVSSVNAFHAEDATIGGLLLMTAAAASAIGVKILKKPAHTDRYY